MALVAASQVAAPGASAAAAAAGGAPRLPAPELAALVEARQYEHVRGLDAAYFEGYRVLREAAGQDMSVPNPLADSYGAYLAFRRQLLQDKLLDQHDVHREIGSYAPHNRFGLGACGGVDAPVSACVAQSPLAAGEPASSSQPPAEQSYTAWRQLLLARRLEARRAALDDELAKRLAAEALERALAAEAAERGTAEAAAGATAPQAGAAAPSQPLVWRVKHVFDDLFNDPELVASVLPPPAPGSQAPRTLPPAYRSITCVSFAKGSNDLFAVGVEAGAVYLCSAITGERWTTLLGHSGAVTAMAWSIGPEGAFLYTASLDRSVRVWSISLPRIIHPTTAGNVAGTATGPARPGVASTPYRVPPAASPPGPASAAKPLALATSPAARTPVKGGEGSTGSRRASSASGAPAAAAAAAAASTPAAPSSGRRGRSAGPAATPRAGAALVGRRVPGASELAGEREKARSEAAAAAAHTGEAAEASAGPRLERGSGHVYCQKTLGVACPVTHLAVCPLNPNLIVAAGLEEGVDAYEAAEGSAGGGYSAQAATTTPAVAPGSSGSGSGFGGLMRAGIRGGMNVVKMTKGALEYVPVVGGALNKTVDVTMAVMKGTVGATMAISGLGDMGSSSAAGEARGVIMVIGVRSARTLQVRRVRGAKLGADLSRSSSVATALAFGGRGDTLFVSDARGRVHMYVLETDLQKQVIKPLKDHFVVFGEGRQQFTGAGYGSYASEEAESGSAPVYLTSLFYRGLDPVAKCPLLLGLDNCSRVRALTVPSLEAVTAAAGMAGMAAAAAAKMVGADSGSGVGGAAGASFSSLSSAPQGAPHCVELTAYYRYATAGPGAATSARSAAGAGVAAGVPPAALRRKLSSSGLETGAAVDPTLARTLRLLSAHAEDGVIASAPAGPGGGPHVAFLPSRRHGGSIVANMLGELFLVDPSGRASASAVLAPASSAALWRTVGPDGYTQAEKATGSGVSPWQIVNKLTAHVHPVQHIDLNRDESVIVTADGAGGVFTWERVPLAAIEGLTQEGSGSTAGGATTGAAAGGATRAVSRGGRATSTGPGGGSTPAGARASSAARRPASASPAPPRYGTPMRGTALNFSASATSPPGAAAAGRAPPMPASPGGASRMQALLHERLNAGSVGRNAAALARAAAGIDRLGIALAAAAPPTAPVAAAPAEVAPVPVQHAVEAAPALQPEAAAAAPPSAPGSRRSSLSRPALPASWGAPTSGATQAAAPPAAAPAPANDAAPASAPADAAPAAAPAALEA